MSIAFYFFRHLFLVPGFWIVGWVAGCTQPPKSTIHRLPSKIALVPLNESDSSALNYLQQHLPSHLPLQVQIWPALSIPHHALHPVRRQYLADSLLTWLKALVQEGMGLMAVTGVDITTTGGNPAGYGTLGLGFRPGRISVVSDYRLNAAHRPDSIRHHMLLKIALHELGHNAGLPHCNTPTCYMQEVEKRGNWEALHSFCSLCQNKIRVP